MTTQISPAPYQFSEEELKVLITSRSILKGPKVRIVVGPKRKLYHLSKTLLCHYSPYFDRCFNGPGKKQHLELLDDKPEYFGVLIDFMLQKLGYTPFDTRCNPGHPEAVVAKCLDFLDCADKYSMGYAAESLILWPLKDALGALEKKGRLGVTAPDIELVYRATSHGNTIRELVVKNIISVQGLEPDTFNKQEEGIAAFAQDMLKFYRSGIKESARQKALAKSRCEIWKKSK